MGSIRDQMEALGDNPYFGAGAGLAGLGIALSLVRRSAVVGNTIFRRRFLISLEINNKDPAYGWVLGYINRHSAQSTRHVTVSTELELAESGRTRTAFDFSPSIGRHFFGYKGRFILVERQRQDQTIHDENMARIPFETVTLTTLGTDPGFFKRMVCNAVNDALASVETGLIVYRAVGPQWIKFGSARSKRPLQSVVLDAGISDRIHNDLNEFVTSSKWYAERGVPYRRGYLFHGPPGCGKSSYIGALASHFGYSICILSLSERTLDDTRLDHLLNAAPKNSIVLLEDIDAAFESRHDHPSMKPAYEGLTRVTFSGLLNAIDGVACAEERLLFMTTNYIDRLDPALIRPGRVDLKQYFGHCTPYMLKQMFSRFYAHQEKDTVEALEKQFVDNCLALDSHISPADVQGHLLFHKDDPLLAVSNVAQIISCQISDRS